MFVLTPLGFLAFVGVAAIGRQWMDQARPFAVPRWLQWAVAFCAIVYVY